MQTFLPHPSFEDSAKCLDYRRLGKQRVEATQIYNAIMGIPRKDGKVYKGWVNHPASVMWRGYEQALLLYRDIMIREWISRGYRNTMPFMFEKNTEDIEFPYWLGDSDFHDSHKSNLLSKDFDFYSQYNWDVPVDLPYIWPHVRQIH